MKLLRLFALTSISISINACDFKSPSPPPVPHETSMQIASKHKEVLYVSNSAREIKAAIEKELQMLRSACFGMLDSSHVLTGTKLVEKLTAEEFLKELSNLKAQIDAHRNSMLEFKRKVDRDEFGAALVIGKEDMGKAYLATVQQLTESANRLTKIAAGAESAAPRLKNLILSCDQKLKLLGEQKALQLWREEAGKILEETVFG